MDRQLQTQDAVLISLRWFEVPRFIDLRAASRGLPGRVLLTPGLLYGGRYREVRGGLSFGQTFSRLPRQNSLLSLHAPHRRGQRGSPSKQPCCGEEGG